MFNKNKKNYLKKIDKSQKGEIDKEIKPLIKLINSKKDYYTTSSCAGRIVLLEITKGKLGNKWLYTTHTKASLKDIKSIKLSKKDIWFRYEPLILHVTCRDLQSAQKIVNTARFVGFKRSGIQSIKTNFVEINSTEVISTIIAKNGKWLVDDNYLKILIKEANKKLLENKKKIKKFYSSLK